MTFTGKRPRRRAAILSLMAVAALLVAGCTDFDPRTAFPPDAASTQGQAVRNIYDVIFLIGIAVFLLVEGLILFAVIRYRRRKGDDELPPQIHGSNKLEIIWTAIPIAIVLALFVVSWQTLNTIDAREKDPPVRIGVVAYQWQWQFVYAPLDIRWEDCGAPQNKGKCVTVFGVPPPGGDRTGWTPPQMHVPVGETVELQMHATDVIHSFYVPAFLYQRDITPRKDQVIQFLADREGTYRGQCTQFCGLLHQAMEFEVVVESRDSFRAWLEQALKPPAAPTPAPSASSEPGASQRPGQSVTLELAAQGIAYDKSSLEAPANTPFKIAFANNDPGIPHSVAIHEGSPTGPVAWASAIFNGTETRTYEVPALATGTYGFVCAVHPTMTGTLTVK
jgi:cytochrome c oxidase subunit II